MIAMSDKRKPIVRATAGSEWTVEPGNESEFRFKDLSGEHLGARIEMLLPGESSSYHHYHTAEEEHLFMLSGAVILIFDGDETVCETGDHIWFRAGDDLAHHFVNRSEQPCTYLVFGERKAEDVVVYPEAQVMMVKALQRRQFTYRPRQLDAD